VARIHHLVLLLAAAGAAAGCVERTLRIRSEPPGLDVTLNGRPVGTTPVEVPFSWYGTVRLETPPTDLDGDGWPEVRRHVALVDLPMPWYQWFPFDFFTDNLVPVTIHDEHEAWVLPLVRGEPSTEEGLEEMRREARELKVRAEKARVEAEVEAGVGTGKRADPEER
jgi:hypothetical protein